MELHLNQDGTEQITYQSAAFPVRAVSAILSEFAGFSASCHWHRDVELLRVDEGAMDYFVNGRIVHIHAGEIVFVNSRRLHYGFSSAQEECRFSCILFHPSLLGEAPLPSPEYFAGLADDAQEDALLLPAEEAVLQPLFASVMARCRLRAPYYELLVQADCILMLHRLCELLCTGQQRACPDEAWQVLRRMVGFVQAHYREALTLQDIAAAGAVCRSGCCRLFRERLGTSPMRFLLQYRLERACERLRAGEKNITQVAHDCGFAGSSYFAEQFRQAYGITPREYLAQGTKKSSRSS